MKTTISPTGFPFSRPLAVLLSLCLALAVCCWARHRCLASKCDSHDTLIAQIRQMAADADTIESLRAAPRLATERERPNHELLAEVRTSMAAADIPPEHWIGNDPLPPVRVPRSPYKRLTVRLMFEELSLKQLVQFVYTLTEINTALSIPQLRLFAPHGWKGDKWNVDMSLCYLIYSPYQEAQP